MCLSCGKPVKCAGVKGFSGELQRQKIAVKSLPSSVDSRNIAVNSLRSSVISSHQLKAEVSRVEKLSDRGRSGVSSTVLSLKSAAHQLTGQQLTQQLIVLRSTVFQINS